MAIVTISYNLDLAHVGTEIAYAKPMPSLRVAKTQQISVAKTQQISVVILQQIVVILQQISVAKIPQIDPDLCQLQLCLSLRSLEPDLDQHRLCHKFEI